MSKIFINESTLTAIADSIRNKTGKTDLIAPLDMPAEIDSITGGGAGELIPLTATENGKYYPREEIDINKELTFKENYTQEELQALFQASFQTEEDDLGTYAFLVSTSVGMIGILYAYGMYGVYISDGHLWIPEEFANEMGFASGWNFGTDITDLAPTDTPAVTFGEMDIFFVEGGLAPLAPLFDLPNADGFSEVTVDVAGANLIPITITENGVYYIVKDVQLNIDYTFRNNYTQAELKALYDASALKSEDGVFAYLFTNGMGTIGIMHDYDMYAVYISAGFIWIPAEFASQMGGSEGWYYGESLESLTPIDTPTANVTEESEIYLEDGLQALKPLFELSEADGFSRVVVEVAGSGGTIEGALAYMVTYVGADGSTLLTKPSVAGDDTYDPYAIGKIDKPTKESTQQYDFTYSGWTLTEGGEASSTALKRIQENRTIYAAFEGTTRTYTARFWDGDTLMLETQVAYGTQATPPNHVKEGTIFMGWTPSDLTITQDTDFYGEWLEGISFESATWEQIKMISESGEASNVFNIGDERTITMTWDDGTTEDCVIRIAAFDADTIYDEAAGTTAGKAGITIDTKNVVSKKSLSRVLYSYHYSYSPLRSAMKNVIYPALPADLQAVIKTTVVPSYNYYECYDKVSPLSMENCGFHQDGVNIKFNTYNAVTYPVYTKATSLADNNKTVTDRIKYGPDGTAVQYWLCDMNQKVSNAYRDTYCFCIATTGSFTSIHKDLEAHLSFRFAI